MRQAIQPTSRGVVPWPAEAAARYVARGYWRGLPLAAHIYAAGRAAPDAVCLADGEVRLTFRELLARADGAAQRLHEAGLRSDDRVVMQLPNCWQFAVLMVALLRLGVIPAMALPANRRQDIAAIVAHIQARALFVPGTARGFDLQAMAHDIAAESDTVDHVLVLGGEQAPGSVDIDALCAPATDPAAASAALDAAAPDPGTVSLFMLSGGTTGAPKLIPRTHNDLAYMCTRAAEICRVGPGDAYLAALPLGHGFPLSGPGLLGTLAAGGRVVMVSSPAPERAFAAIERERVTITSLVPAALQRWIEHRDRDRGADLSSLRLVQLGGSHLPVSLAKRVAPTLGCTLQQVYGMSEGLLCLTRPDDPAEVILHTQGRPICPDDEILLVDAAGDPVPAGEPGVLLTRGPYTPRGYYRAPELDAQAFVGDGWYRTGDIVRQRPDGNLVIEGRDKDVINRGGEKIAADEVEHVVLRIAGIGAAAAVAMPDPELGERICLYVVPEPGATVTLDQVRSTMERFGMARFKLPERLILVDDLPRTSVGKLDKRALRADLHRRLAAGAQPAN